MESSDEEYEEEDSLGYIIDDYKVFLFLKNELVDKIYDAANECRVLVEPFSDGQTSGFMIEGPKKGIERMKEKMNGFMEHLGEFQTDLDVIDGGYLMTEEGLKFVKKVEGNCHVQCEVLLPQVDTADAKGRVSASRCWRLPDGQSVTILQDSIDSSGAHVVVETYETVHEEDYKIQGVRDVIRVQFPIQPFRDKSSSPKRLTDNMAKLLDAVISRRVTSVAFTLERQNTWAIDVYVTAVLTAFLTLAGGRDKSQRTLSLCATDPNVYGRGCQVCDAVLTGKGSRFGATAEHTTEGQAPINITVVEGSLDAMKADALVCTIADDLDLTRGAVSCSLLDTAGDALQYELDRYYPDGLSPGKIAVTHGHCLKCKHVFYGVMYPYDDEFCQSYDNAEDYYKVSVHDFVYASMRTAEKLKVRSIAFPSIGSGNLFFPISIVVDQMFHSVESFQQDKGTCIKDVRFVVYPTDKEALAAFRAKEEKYVAAQKAKLYKSMVEAGTSSEPTTVRITGMEADVEKASLHFQDRIERIQNLARAASPEGASSDQTPLLPGTTGERQTEAEDRKSANLSQSQTGDNSGRSPQKQKRHTGNNLGKLRPSDISPKCEVGSPKIEPKHQGSVADKSSSKTDQSASRSRSGSSQNAHQGSTDKEVKSSQSATPNQQSAYFRSRSVSNQAAMSATKSETESPQNAAAEQMPGITVYPHCTTMIPPGHGSEEFVCYISPKIKLHVYTGDLFRLKNIDMVACSNKSHGNGTGFVAEKLKEKSGPAYVKDKDDAFRRRKPDLGHIVVCSVGQSCFKYVAHAILYQIKDTNGKEDRQQKVDEVFTGIFINAKKFKCSSLALPLLGTGKGNADTEYYARRFVESLYAFRPWNKDYVFNVHLVNIDADSTNIAINTITTAVSKLARPYAVGRGMGAPREEKSSPSAGLSSVGGRRGRRGGGTWMYSTLPSRSGRNSTSSTTSEDAGTGGGSYTTLPGRRGRGIAKNTGRSQHDTTNSLDTGGIDIDADDNGISSSKMQISQKEGNQSSTGNSTATLDPCAFCTDDMTDPKILPCGHSFCNRCIDQIFRHKKVCPMCGAVWGNITENSIIIGSDAVGEITTKVNTVHTGSSANSIIMGSDVVGDITTKVNVVHTGSSDEDDTEVYEEFDIVLRSKNSHAGCDYVTNILKARHGFEALKWRFVFKNKEKINRLAKKLQVIDAKFDSMVSSSVVIETDRILKYTDFQKRVKSFILEETADLKVDEIYIDAVEAREVIKVVTTTCPMFTNQLALIFLEGSTGRTRLWFVALNRVYDASLQTFRKAQDYIRHVIKPS